MDAGITISSTSQPALVRRSHRECNRRTNPSLSLGPRVAGDEYVIPPLKTSLWDRSEIWISTAGAEKPGYPMAADAAETKHTSHRACKILVRIDPPTARRRLSGLNDAIRRVSPEPVCRRSIAPELGALSQFGQFRCSRKPTRERRICSQMTTVWGERPWGGATATRAPSPRKADGFSTATHR